MPRSLKITAECAAIGACLGVIAVYVGLMFGGDALVAF